MSEQTLIRGESIEHLEPELVCGSPWHTSDRPRATHWYNQHGCEEDCFCTPCIESGRTRFNQLAAARGHVPCEHCDRSFTTFESCVKVVPL